MTADLDQASPTLDPSEVRSPRGTRRTLNPGAKLRVKASAPRRALALAGAFVGAVLIGGAGFAGYSWLAPAPSEVTKPRSASITAGPLPDMPEIRDGVPALLSRAPVRVVGAGGPSGPASAAPSVDRRLRDAAAARALEMTVQTAALRPGLAGLAAGPQPETARLSEPIRPAEPVRSAEPVRPAEPAPAAIASIEPPAPTVTTATPVQPVRPADTTSSTGEAPSVEPAAPRAAVPPLPPVRAVGRPPEAKPERTAAVPPRVAPVRTSTPRAPAASVAQAPLSLRPDGQPRTEPPPRTEPRPPAEEKLDVLGVRLPDFVPQTGRRIRDAAGSIADAVAGLPDLF